MGAIVGSCYRLCLLTAVYVLTSYGKEIPYVPRRQAQSVVVDNHRMNDGANNDAEQADYRSLTFCHGRSLPAQRPFTAAPF